MARLVVRWLLVRRRSLWSVGGNGAGLLVGGLGTLLGPEGTAGWLLSRGVPWWWCSLVWGVSAGWGWPSGRRGSSYRSWCWRELVVGVGGAGCGGSVVA